MLQTKTFGPVISIADKTLWIIISRGNWGTEGSAGLNFTWTLNSLMIFSLKGHAFLWWILLPRPGASNREDSDTPDFINKHPPFLRLHPSELRKTAGDKHPFNISLLLTFLVGGVWYLYMHALNHKHPGEMHSIKVLKPHFLRSIVPLTHERATHTVYAKWAPGGIQRRPDLCRDREPYGPQSSVSLPLCWSNTDYDNSAPHDPNLSHLNRCESNHVTRTWGGNSWGTKNNFYCRPKKVEVRQRPGPNGEILC